MSVIASVFSTLSLRRMNRIPLLSIVSQNIQRSYADKPSKPKSDAKKVTAKDIMVQGTENEEKVRVRRARPADVPKVLRFVRENAMVAWPGLVNSKGPASAHLALNDIVTRALAQGHSMLAEQQENRRGWTQIRGLALSTSVCPWDAAMIERWAKCLRCTNSRRLMSFTAHCLRAPALHDKYRVHNIMQVVIIVPVDYPKSEEIIHMLAKHTIKRGQEVGFPLVRFDVTNVSVAKSLEELKLKKEWQLTYEILPEVPKTDRKIEQNRNSKIENQNKDQNIGQFTEQQPTTLSETVQAESGGTIALKRTKYNTRNSNFIAVYTTFTQGNEKSDTTEK